MNKIPTQQLRLTTMIFYSNTGEPGEPIECLEFKDSGFVMAKPNEDSKEWVRQVQIAFAEKDHN
ncbi:MAG: hypothetical protein EBX41_11250, partial [Chitinophagia bacterium]|nr:hypothetical protein [Chitinophagia bacterium]